MNVLQRLGDYSSWKMKMRHRDRDVLRVRLVLLIRRLGLCISMIVVIIPGRRQ